MPLKDKTKGEKKMEQPIDSREASPPKSDYPVNDLITYYNSLPNIQKHTKSTSKVYKKIDRYIKRLKNGTFGRYLLSSHSDVFDFDWHSKNHITKWLDHKFSNEEIKKMLDNINKYFSNEFYPNGEKRSLDIMLFNPHISSGKSLALWLFLSPPIAGQLIIKDRYPHLTALYQNTAFSTHSFTDKSSRALILAVNSFADAMEEKRALFKQYGYESFYMDGIYTRHAEWIRDNVRKCYSPANLISMSNGFWSNFVAFISQDIGVDLEPSLDKLKGNAKKSSQFADGLKQQKRYEERVMARQEIIASGNGVLNTRHDPRIDHWKNEEIDCLFGDDSYLDLDAIFGPINDEDEIEDWLQEDYDALSTASPFLDEKYQISNEFHDLVRSNIESGVTGRQWVYDAIKEGDAAWEKRLTDHQKLRDDFETRVRLHEEKKEQERREKASRVLAKNKLNMERAI